MSDVYRLFDVNSRALKCIKGNRTSAGQVYDSCSTTIHFEYSDLTFLEPSPSGEAWIPYIIFDVRDENGIVLAYGPQSKPVFDGYTFDIPFDVTTRVKGNRLQYQLCFSKNTYAVDDRGVVQIVSDPQNLMSAIDGIVIKPSIKCKPCGGPECLPPVPFTQPNVAGLLQMFQDHGVVVPVQDYIDDSMDRLCLMFRTYSGLNDCRVVLQVPYLTEDGQIPSHFLDIITKWADEQGLLIATDENIPSALLVKKSLDDKLDDAQLIIEWTAVPSDERIPSEKLVKDSLDKKVDDTQIVSAWSDPLSDGNIASEKLTKETIDTKTDKLMAIPPWENDVTYSKDSTVICNGTIYISLRDDNRNNDPTVDDYYWTMVEAGAGTLDEDGNFVTMVGDGINTEYVITHNRGTLNYFLELRTNDSERRYVSARVNAMDMNTVRVSFTSPPVENGIILIMARGDRTKSVYCEPIGNGRDNEYIVTHNLGMYNFFVELRTNDSDREYVDATVTAINPVQAKIHFEYPVEENGVVVMIAPCVASKWGSRWVYAQLDPSSEWVIDHDLTRMVSVQTFTPEGYLLYGTVKQDLDSLDSVTVRFSQPTAGFAVLQ